jgi:poly(3-hydroxybutyrate) depolymerase
MLESPNSPVIHQVRMVLCLTVLLVADFAVAIETIKASVVSDLVPSPVEYALIAPDGFRTMKDLPLVLNLHGGGGNRDRLLSQAKI